MKTTDGVQHTVEVEPAEGDIVEGVVRPGQQKLVADQNNDGEVDDSGMSNPVDNLGASLIVSQIKVDRDLNERVIRYDSP